MSGTAKTVLIVGGVAVGTVVLFKLLQPSPLAARRASPAPGLSSASVASTIGGLASIVGIFGSKGSPTAADGTPVNVPGQYIFNSADTKQVGNEIVDTATGQALVYGTD